MPGTRACSPGSQAPLRAPGKARCRAEPDPEGSQHRGPACGVQALGPGERTSCCSNPGFSSDPLCAGPRGAGAECWDSHPAQSVAASGHGQQGERGWGREGLYPSSSVLRALTVTSTPWLPITLSTASLLPLLPCTPPSPSVKFQLLNLFSFDPTSAT